MDQALLDKLKCITNEERVILEGNHVLQSKLYTSDFNTTKYQDDTNNSSQHHPNDISSSKEITNFIIDSNHLLSKGQLIDIRPHTRFIHFPKHTHNYVEMVYMCSGTTTHILNDSDTIVLEEGDLLFLNQNTTQEILPASETDIAVNFIILPEFFHKGISMIEGENVLRDFLLSTLSHNHTNYSYLHFHAKEILPVQNLIENMIWTIFSDSINTNIINQTTMGLIFMNLSVYADTIYTNKANQFEQDILFTVLKYIETNYKSGTLEDICTKIKQPTYYISRLLKKHTNKNFKELLQDRKLQEAAFLLKQSDLSTEKIIEAIGYNNSSYFHRKFRIKYNCSPKEYRCISLQQ